MIKIAVYVPEDALETVKSAMFEAGAGRTERYEQCAWQTLGQGQFKPLPHSNPTLGEINQLTYVREYKLEMICEEAVLRDVVAAMKRAHPYEEPAYGAWPLIDI
ncbi:NGG1p interacting factor NIF3 [Saccharophagus sp. K07]|jgi:hypothetical protein|uniref:NGG1p interacting factor NIF3 n=1 Tax=Saccharophagus sp. K07 TaxID=2283636 RepID=UPI001652329B|nr:NGG1p interacting factor NIF3 [Saccharophagus sp. K07]MBC6903858.1 NGG1p interacting factor NIF3 [Saccharophagus sp. K07]